VKTVVTFCFDQQIVVIGPAIVVILSYRHATRRHVGFYS